MISDDTNLLARFLLKDAPAQHRHAGKLGTQPPASAP